MSIIHYKLDLILQLVDATTGSSVDEQNVQIYSNGEPQTPISRGNGNFVFINTGRSDHTLTLRVFGYEDCQVNVQYEKLDERMPLMQVFLIPSENFAKGERLLSLSGNLPNLEEIEAVSLTQSNYFTSEFNERKLLLKLFLPQGRLSMGNVHYGLINEEQNRYEHIEIVDEVLPDTVRLKEPLQETFKVNAPISKVIFGKVSPDGSYLLRIRDNAKVQRYLVRYRVNGETRFQIVDFNQCRENELK